MLKARILTALVLVPCFLMALFYLPAFAWSGLMLVISCIGAWEWAGMIGFKACKARLYTLCFGLLCLTFSLESSTSTITALSSLLFLIAAIFWILCVPLWLIQAYSSRRQFGLALVGIVLLLPTWLALTKLRDFSPWLLLSALGVVWIADTAAYFAGKRFGKNKLAPSISPGKTWEGVWGAFVAVTAYTVLLCYFNQKGFWWLVGAWALLVFSIMGDLFESHMKRQAGIKDSGQLLPGHGGVLDRIDGLTSTMPLVACYLYFPYAIETLQTIL